MTRLEAYAMAEKIVGPAGKINPPIEMLPAITEELMKVQEETVRACWKLVVKGSLSNWNLGLLRRKVEKEFEGVDLA